MKNFYYKVLRFICSISGHNPIDGKVDSEFSYTTQKCGRCKCGLGIPNFKTEAIPVPSPIKIPEGNVINPRKPWYSEEDMKSWLLHNKYSEEIARELAPMLSKNYNSAFNKGYQMGRDDTLSEMRREVKIKNVEAYWDDSHLKEKPEVCPHVNSERMPRLKNMYNWRYCNDCNTPYKNK